MAVNDLTSNVDATYADDPQDPSRQLHQQDHDEIHGWLKTAGDITAAVLTTNSVLDDLSDVTETAITSGDLLRWNGTTWVNYAGSNYATSGHGHTSVDISDFAEAVSDQVGTMVAGNTETGITVTYDDLDNTLDFVLAFDSTLPVTLTPDITGAAGSTTIPARRDHVHNVPADTAVGLSNASTSTEGTSGSFARADHTHAVTGFALTSHAHSAADITSGTLAVARGGTGIASYTTNNYIRASGTTTLEQRTPAQVLTDIGAATSGHTHPFSDHGALTGLADDDHPQYFNSTRHDAHDHSTALGTATTTDLAEGTNLYYTTTRANSAIDTRVTKTFVDALNINADTLDGIDSTGFATSSHNHDAAYVDVSGDTMTGFLTLHADPSSSLHAATKQYVDGIAAGLDWKSSVRAISTTNITLSGTQTVDGVSLLAGDRVLVAGQTTASQNGIYVVAAGAWSRSSDADASSEVTSGMAVFVEEGTTNADTGWVLTTDGAITLGTTSLTFTQFTSLGQITAGAGLTKTGNSIDVVAGNASISVAADAVSVGFDATVPVALTPNITGATGSAVVPARRDHVHNISAAAAVGISNSSTNTQGTSSSFARADHTHAVTGFALTSHNHAATEITSGTLAVARGGTGIASYTANNYIRASAATTLEQRTPAQVLADIGAAASSHAHSAADITSGTLAVARGGTGIASYTIGNYIYASGATTLAERTPSQVLSDIGAASSGHNHNGVYSPTGHTHAAADTTSGTFADLRISQSSVTQHQAALDHGSIAGLADDDHTQYLNTARHDAHDHSTAMGTVVLENISDVVETTITTGDVLRWNGTNWVNYADSNFASSGHNHDAAYVNETDHTKAAHDALGIDADTVDGSHASALLARANHTGTQLSTTISDFDEAVSDQVGTMVTTNTETGITVTYQDVDNTLDFVLDFDAIAPPALTPDIAGAAGSTTVPARRDHVHNVPADIAVGISNASSNAEGTSNSFARADHTHAVTGFALTSHNHDSSYYTESEVDTFLSGKSDTSHNHDAAYINASGDTMTGFLTLNADPTSSLHAATKQYVDGIASGLNWKASVRAISTSNITLSGTQSIDGVALSAGNRVLVAGQTTASQNGIYVVAAGAWSRASDADASSEVTPGMAVFVEEGTTNADTGWVLSTDGAITLGTTALTFTQFTSLGQINAGAGLTKTGNTLDVVAGNASISVAADAISVGFDATAPATLTPDIASSVGSAVVPARRDHVHNVPADIAVGISNASTNAEGTSNSFARADHTHAVTGFALTSHAHSAADITSGTLAVARGGTGIASYTTNNYIRASGATTLEQRTPAQVLTDIGAAATSHNHSAANITSGTLAVAQGGTGIGSYTVGNYIYASAATTLAQRTPAQVLSDIGAAASGHNHDSSYVASNTAITPGTATKITYDAKGLVTAGTSLVAGDIPSLDTAKITTGTFADARISQSSVTQHQAALTITESQISNLAHLTIEEVQDNLGTSFLVAGTNISLSYNDAANTLTVNSTGGSSDHGTLTGLADDDHTQYLNESRHNALDHSTALASTVLSDISNVTETTITTGDLLRWNGTAWVNYADSNYATSGHNHNSLYATISHNHSAADVTSGTLAVARGGTGIASYTVGNYINASGATTLQQRTPAQVLSDIGAAAASHNHSAANITSGTLAVAQGGTGIGSYTVGNYINASGATTLQQRTPAQVLSDIGAAASSHNHSAANITSGTLAVAQGGTGIGSYTTGNYINASGATTLQQRTPAQVLSDIGAASSGHNHDASYLSLSGGTLTGALTLSGDPSSALHAATKQYVDGVAAGLSWKASVRAISTSNITLSGTQTVDGVSLVAGNRILVAGQTTASQNGIYVVAAGAWSRATDADTSAEVPPGTAVFVESGTANADSGWVLTTDGPITLGTTSLTFTQFTSLGQITAGAGLTKTGNSIDVVAGNASVSVAADAISVGFDATVPPALTPNITGATGSAVVPARRDHVHNVSAAAAVGISNASTNTEGTSSSFARADHTHAVTGFALTSHAHSAADITSGTLPVGRGGTGIVAYTTGNYINAASASALQQRTPAQVLSDIGAAASSHNHSAANITSGTLGVAQGGTGIGSYTVGNYVYASGATTLAQRTPAQVLSDIGALPLSGGTLTGGLKVPDGSAAAPSIAASNYTTTGLAFGTGFGIDYMDLVSGGSSRMRIQGVELEAFIPLKMSNNVIKDVASPTNSTDAATKGYVDDLQPGLRAVQVYTAGATWTKPSWLRVARVIVLGGGGGGGGSGAVSAGQGRVGSGGGGGQYREGVIAAGTLGATETVTVGSGGAGGGGANNGSAGSSSSFGTHITATGGTGGTAGGAVGTGWGAVAGGDGGTGGSGGSLAVDGGDADNALVQANQVAFPSAGGGSFFHPGGAANQNNNAKSANGTNGARGSGGAGSLNTGGGTASGGDGGAGLVIVYEYA